MKKNIIKSTTKNLKKATSNIVTGAVVLNVTIGACVLCTAMDIAEGAMGIGAIAVATPLKIVNTNTKIIKGMYEAITEEA